MHDERASAVPFSRRAGVIADVGLCGQRPPRHSRRKEL